MKKTPLIVYISTIGLFLALCFPAGISSSAQNALPSLTQLCISKLANKYEKTANEIINSSQSNNNNAQFTDLVNDPAYNFIGDNQIAQLITSGLTLPWLKTQLQTKELTEASHPKDTDGNKTKISGICGPNTIDVLTFDPNNTLYVDNDTFLHTWAWDTDSKELIEDYSRSKCATLAHSIAKPLVKFSVYNQPHASIHYRTRITSSRHRFSDDNTYPCDNNVDTLTILANNEPVLTWQIPFENPGLNRRLHDAIITALSWRIYQENYYIYIGTNLGHIYTWQITNNETNQGPKQIQIGRNTNATHGEPITNILHTPQKHVITLSKTSTRRANISPSAKSPVTTKCTKNGNHETARAADNLNICSSDLTSKIIARGGWHKTLTIENSRLKTIQTVDIGNSLSTLAFNSQGNMLAAGTIDGAVFLLEDPQLYIKTPTQLLETLIAYKKSIQPQASSSSSSTTQTISRQRMRDSSISTTTSESKRSCFDANEFPPL